MRAEPDALLGPERLSRQIGVRDDAAVADLPGELRSLGTEQDLANSRVDSVCSDDHLADEVVDVDLLAGDTPPGRARAIISLTTCSRALPDGPATIAGPGRRTGRAVARVGSYGRRVSRQLGLQASATTGSTRPTQRRPQPTGEPGDMTVVDLTEPIPGSGVRQ